MKSQPTLLLVDDDPYVRRVIRGMLRGMGYLIREATDGREALELLSLSRPDVILLNLVMPKMNGFAVLDELRVMGLIEEVPVLVVTGSLTPARVIYQKGARGVLRKPFRMRALRSAVEIVAGGGSLDRRRRPLRGGCIGGWDER